MPDALLVEELVERGVGADGDDQGGAGEVGEEQRDVLAGAGGGEARARDAEPLEAVAADGAAGAVGVQHHLTGRAQRLVGDGGPVSLGACVGESFVADHDQVGAVPGLEQCVGAGVDPDQHGTLLADEAAQRAQVLAVVVARDHHDHGPAR